MSEAKQGLIPFADLPVSTLKSVVEGLPFATIVTDNTGIIQWANPACAAMFACDPQDLVKRNIYAVLAARHDPDRVALIVSEAQSGAGWSGPITLESENLEIQANLTVRSVMENGNLVNVAYVFQDESEWHESHTRLRAFALHDHLTGLPNRANFYEKLAYDLALSSMHGGKAYVLFLDLDRFKLINDSLGHDVGDQLLIEASQRILALLPKELSLARLGGDEFVIHGLLKNSSVVDILARKIIDALEQPFNLGRHCLALSGSIGVCAFPDDGADIRSLMCHADSALYEAKRAGKGTWRYFHAGLAEDAATALDVENGLRQANIADEFVLHYQPQLDLRTNTVCGVEALIRWKHPEKGMISPDTFIPVAEETGLITVIGEWALRQACLQLKTWQTNGFPIKKMAVNLSCRQFRAANLIEVIASAIESAHLDPRCLDLEITESAIMDNIESSVNTMRQLKKLGVSLSLDDFGTGYSSLGHLKKFPLDKLKIDRTFMAGVPDTAEDVALIRAIIALADALNLQSLAEGVETQEQVDFLMTHGCQLIQGYWLARPLPPEQIEQLISSNAIKCG